MQPATDLSEDTSNAELLVAENLAHTTANPPIQAATEEAVAPQAVPPLSHATSSLSSHHLLSGSLHDRKTGVRAWMRGLKETAKNNYFGVKTRLRSSSVETIIRQSSPSEQRELLAMIESNIDHRDAHTVAALYTVTASNYQLPEFKEPHRKICALMETLPISVVTEVRDIIDRTSEGRGFLPLVLAGGMDHYKVLKFSASITAGYLPPRRCMKIFSDIDDTCIANWIDLRQNSRYGWEPKIVYPGVRELHKQIIEHAGDAQNKTVDLIFLSSRPLRHQLLTIDALKSYGFGIPQPGNFTLLYGEFLSNLTPRTMGVFKYQMFKLYSGLYPHMDYVFFGDSGQGDYRCGELLLRNPRPGTSRCRGVFIHEIRPDKEMYRQMDPSTPTQHVHYFYHYAQAAQMALSEGLISEAGYAKVIEAFISESRQLAAAKLGNPAAILATFKEAAEANPAQHPATNSMPLSPDHNTRA